MPRGVPEKQAHPRWALRNTKSFKEKRKMKKRCSGILMPVSSLPGGYGIGSMGQAARDFVDFLVLAGQSVWQILPVGPTSYGDSPYQSCSAFCGQPVFY